jgi:hypothetical protein
MICSAHAGACAERLEAILRKRVALGRIKPSRVVPPGKLSISTLPIGPDNCAALPERVLPRIWIAM